MMIIMQGMFSFGLLFFSHCFNFFRCIKSIIGMSFFYQLLCILFINTFPFTLAVRCISSPNMRAFIGLKAAPM